MSKRSWYVYIVRCADNSLYTGITTDLERRINEHNNSNQSGAVYTRIRRPVRLIYQENHPARSAAAKREYEIKQMSKNEKEAILTQS